MSDPALRVGISSIEAATMLLSVLELPAAMRAKLNVQSPRRRNLLHVEHRALGFMHTYLIQAHSSSNRVRVCACACVHARACGAIVNSIGVCARERERKTAKYRGR